MLTADVLREVRKAKSQAQVKMRAPVRRVIVHDTPERLACAGARRRAICSRRARSSSIEMLEADELAVEVELAEEAAGSV